MPKTHISFDHNVIDHIDDVEKQIHRLTIFIVHIFLPYIMVNRSCKTHVALLSLHLYFYHGMYHALDIEVLNYLFGPFFYVFSQFYFVMWYVFIFSQYFIYIFNLPP